MTPIVVKYGGILDKSFSAEMFWAEGLEKPDVVNFVHYKSKQAFEDFKSDLDSKKLFNYEMSQPKLFRMKVI